ncbi:Ferric iron ABC transporter, permease protein [Sporomusa ovata]|uniref:Ferric iron ABC transporter, permease protein n=1 Tax=Sporomusa ovata TaxID=2378 RepID=A0A0U1KWI0_9FIRM|nr:Ferric iron ABC transporter, permease protein [Sporomusa ovata]
MLAIAASIVLFILWPIAAVLLKRFVVDGQITLRLFQEVLPDNFQYLGNSIFVALLSTILTLLVALCIALYENYSTGRFRNLVMPLLLLTMISPPFVSSLAYITLFGRRGFITNTLLGLSSNPYGWHGIVIMQALGEISLTALLLIGVLRGIDGKLLQASRDLGASTSETLRRIVLPLLLPGIGAAGFIAFVKSLADFGTPIVIGGNFSVLATEAYLMVISRGDIGKAAVISIMILVPALIGWIFYRRTESQGVFSNMAGIKIKDGEPELQLGKGMKSLLAAITWFFFALMLVQFLTILLTAVTRYSPGGYIFTGEYLKAMNPDKWSSILRSVWYAFQAGVIASLVGVLLAYYIERRGIWGGRVLEWMANLPYIIPGTLFGIGYILAFHTEPLELTGTAMIVVINCIFRQITVAAKAGSAVLANISPDIENAAKDLGTPPVFILKDIIFPLLKPAVLVSFVNTFTATMMTIGSIIFIISPNAKVATVELFGLLNQGFYGEAAVFAVVLTLLTMAGNLLFAWALHNKEKEKDAAYVPYP